ncbi:sensor domain-containing protein [Bacillus suaedaesalsae]|uniref:Diguanylate cyclase n=1 Tax=Bacillus suaedaesalsae TaxID=2810349 RepID=A0ABS2DDX0_9BACI|nr:diguanylate cyclase [Bacillus suaedaesalsae]MBM6616649.1 diguanylate cyclase [Bacillus suaedaesalsae]
MDNFNIELFKKFDIFIKIFNSIYDMVYITKVEEDGHFSYLLANDAAKRFIGLTEESFGKRLDEIMPKGAAQIISKKYQQAIEMKNEISYEEKMNVPPHITNHVKYAPNDIVYWESSITPIFDDNGSCTHLFAIVRDITERKENEEKLKRLAHYDYLTGLPNRVLFTKRLKEELEKLRQNDGLIAVMFLDLDNFKDINDTMGHDVGDLILQSFGNKVKNTLRSQDVLSRLGGDEFVILLPNLPEEKAAMKIAENIVQSLQYEWNIEGYQFKSTTSIGIAFYRNEDIQHNELLKKADIALYQAKQKGKNKYHIYEEEGK